jgi:hypothetical protein
MLTGKISLDSNQGKGLLMRWLFFDCSRPRCSYVPAASVVIKVLSPDIASLPAASFDLTL